MRIQRIEVVGFKSFCDRTVVRIDDAITSIVGPNGCGKSNIVDAIRWCMGEQSAKHLRGKSMEDVIFAGSETRAAASMAEVSLTFDDVGYSSAFGDGALANAEGAAEATTEGTVEEAGDSTDGPIAITETPDISPVDSPMNGDGPAEGDNGVANVEAKQQGEVTTGQVSREVAEFIQESAQTFDFSQFTEVTITRRLFRDGSSHYLINKVPCRLRDVTDFFLGTGVGTKAYSIIEQGRVGQIVSSRPKDRRTLIDEAAGITKYKTKKRSAVRKLDQTEQNLLRITDIVTELEQRSKNLQRQAKKAERYKRYKAELKDIDLWTASMDYLSHLQKKRIAEGELQGKAEELQHGRAEVADVTVFCQEERQSLADKQKSTGLLQEKVYECENLEQLTRSKVEYINKEIVSCVQRIDSAQREIETLTLRKHDSKQALQETIGGLHQIVTEAELGNASVRDAELQRNQLRSQLEEWQGRLDGVRDKLAQVLEDKIRASEKKELAERQLEEASQAKELQHEQLQTASQKVRALAGQVSKQEKELDRLRQTKLNLGSQVAAVTQELSESELRAEENRKAYDAISETWQQKKARLLSLVELEQKYEGCSRGTQAVFTDNDSGLHSQDIYGLVAEAITVPQEMEAAVESALGDALRGVIVSSGDTAVRAVDFLRQGQRGWSVFINAGEPRPASEGLQPVVGQGVVGRLSDFVTIHSSLPGTGLPSSASSSASSSSVASNGALSDEVAVSNPSSSETVEPAWCGIISSLLADYWLVETLEVATRLRETGVRSPMVTKSGDRIDEKGVIRGGYTEVAGLSILARRREVRELTASVSQLETDKATAEAERISSDKHLENVRARLKAIAIDDRQGEVAVLSTGKDYENNRQRLSDLQAQVEKIQNELLRLEALIARCEADVRGGQQVALQSEESTKRLVEKQNEAQQKAKEIGELFESATGVLTSAKVRAAQLSEQHASVEAATDRIREADAELDRKVEQLQAAIGQTAGDKMSLESQIEELEQRINEVVVKKTDSQKQWQTAQTDCAERSQKLTEKEIYLQQRRSFVDGLVEVVANVEGRILGLDTECRVLVEQMEERYQVHIPSELCDFHMRALPGKEQVARAKELRRLLRGMGEINLTAIAEYEEVSQRFAYLSAQKLDLENAVDQLQKAISKINRTSRKLFRETFESVNKTFGQLFPKLFRGGKASLSLVGNDEDILESGIDIMAQPPGKKNTTVEQLSGGEKALTAVALIFSIFLIKPSPFCVLDEVDAPLDDGNVDRYNEIVRTMTDRSQFIVITHNKRTMEIADHLYGVTMQEPGVSKLVAVNLSKTQQAAA